MTDPLHIPANISPFVEVFGTDLTVKFLLKFGGTGMYLPDSFPREGGMFCDLVGREKAIELGQKMGGGLIEVPVSKRFIAQYYYAQGDTIADICRRLHLTRPTVRGYISANDRNTRQLTLKF